MESNLKIVIVNGMPGCGKTTFETYCKFHLGAYCKIISTIDIIKQMARVGGWNGEKDPKSRKMLSDLKDLLTDWDDVPYKRVEKAVNEFNRGLKERGYE